MLGNKLRKEHIIKAFNNTLIYQVVLIVMENILGSIDNGIKLLNMLTSVISPLLDKYASHHSNSIYKSVMNAVKGYNDIKHEVLESHDNVYNDYMYIKHKLF